jgi:hypothetical protein
MFTKKKLSDISEDERRELYKLYIKRFGFVIFANESVENLVIDMFSDNPSYKHDNKIIENFKKTISSAVDNDLIRYFKAESEFKSSSKNNEKPF